MARAENTELIDDFEEFYRNYYRNEIGELAQQYPTERKSLYVDWQELYRFDPDLADDYRAHPEEFQEYAEEALRLYDLPVDVKLGQAHVRVRNLPETTDIREIRADHRGDVGGYAFRRIGERDGRVECTTPYPCAFDRGFVDGVAATQGEELVCFTEVGACRDDGADRCTYEIQW